MTDMTKGATPAHPTHGGVDPGSEFQKGYEAWKSDPTLGVHRAAPKPPTVDIELGPPETPADLLKRLGDDGAKWAAEFRKTAPALGYSDMDEGWLIGWFANAIECSGDVRRWRAEKAAPLDALERNVVEAAEKWADYLHATYGRQTDYTPTATALGAAVDALRAARAPRDPVAELREAAEPFLGPSGDRDSDRLRAAIAAIAGRDGE